MDDERGSMRFTRATSSRETVSADFRNQAQDESADGTRQVPLAVMVDHDRERPRVTASIVVQCGIQGATPVAHKQCTHLFRLPRGQGWNW